MRLNTETFTLGLTVSVAMIVSMPNNAMAGGIKDGDEAPENNPVWYGIKLYVRRRKLKLTPGSSNPAS